MSKDQFLGARGTREGARQGAALVPDEFHQRADTDSAREAIHHTLGNSASQSAAGNHLHDHIYSRAYLGELFFGFWAPTTFVDPARPELGLVDQVDDWALMNGQTLTSARENYGEFVDVLDFNSVSWYNSGANTIVLPDVRRRIVVGQANFADSAGYQFGDHDAISVFSRTPDVHNHSISAAADHKHGVTGSTGSTSLNQVGTTTNTGSSNRLTQPDAHTHGAGTLDTNDNGAHSHGGATGDRNMPYMMVGVWVRVRLPNG